MGFQASKVVEKAKEVLCRFAIFSAPVDVEDIATREGIKVIYEDLEDDVSGLLFQKNGMSIIAVNAHHHPHRQKFTIAHELGHYYLHETGADRLFVDRIVYFRNSVSSSGAQQHEIEANKFAAELLMPMNLVKAILESYPSELSEHDTFKLANQFGVSQQAMTFRLTNLDVAVA